MLTGSGINLVLASDRFEDILDGGSEYLKRPRSEARCFKSSLNLTGAASKYGFVYQLGEMRCVSIAIYRRYPITENELAAAIMRLSKLVFEDLSQTAYGLEIGADTKPFFREFWGYDDRTLEVFADEIESDFPEQFEPGFFLSDKGQLAQEDWTVPDLLEVHLVSIGMDLSLGIRETSIANSYLVLASDWRKLEPKFVHSNAFLGRLEREYRINKLTLPGRTLIDTSDPWGLVPYRGFIESAD